MISRQLDMCKNENIWKKLKGISRKEINRSQCDFLRKEHNYLRLKIFKMSRLSIKSTTVSDSLKHTTYLIMTFCKLCAVKIVKIYAHNMCII